MTDRNQLLEMIVTLHNFHNLLIDVPKKIDFIKVAKQIIKEYDIKLMEVLKFFFEKYKTMCKNVFLQETSNGDINIPIILNDNSIENQRFFRSILYFIEVLPLTGGENLKFRFIPPTVYKEFVESENLSPLL